MESVNMIFEDVPPEEYEEYSRDYFKCLSNSQNYTKDKNTGEVRFKINVVVGIVTKPSVK